MRAIVYELWDQDSGNLIGSYDTVDMAFADVRDTVDRYGRASAEMLVLLSSDDDEAVDRVAAGGELIKLAENAAASVSYLGVGLYTMRDAARIIQAKPSDLRRWLKRDKYQSHGRTYRRLPFVARMLPLDADAVTLSELLELHAISELRQRGFAMGRIRALSAKLVEQWEVDFPLTSKRFANEFQIGGPNIFRRPSDGTVLVFTSGQLAMLDVVAPLLEDVDFSTEGTALQYWPLTRKSRVVLDAQRQFGQPIDAPTGVPTHTLYMATRANPYDSDEMVARWFGVDVAAVRDAVSFEAPRAA